MNKNTNQHLSLPATISESDFNAVCDVLSAAKNILIASHYNPDGDTLGAALALYYFFSPEKEITLYCRDNVPYNYTFLPGSHLFTKELPDIKQFDVIALVDVGSAERVSEDLQKALERNPNARVVVIDHHPQSGDGEPSIASVIDPEAGAVGEIIYYILKKMGAEITKEIAAALYTCLHTDTGGFSYSNTSDRIMKVASELLQSGLKVNEVTYEIYENQPIAQLKLISKTLSSLELKFNGKCASIFVTQEDYKSTGANVEMTERLINFPRSIKGAEVALAFRQLKNLKEYKISLRSSGHIDVNALARLFGGGGHTHAAGCTLTGALDEVKQKIYTAVERALKN